MGREAAGPYRPGGRVMQRRLLKAIREIVIELTISGLLPERIGRYRVIDVLQSLEDRS